MNPRVLVIEPTRSETAVVDDETIRDCLPRSWSTPAGFGSTAGIRRHRLDSMETFHRVGCDLIILQYSHQDDSSVGMLQRLPAEVPIVVLVNEDDRRTAEAALTGREIELVVRSDRFQDDLRTTLSRASARAQIRRNNKDLARAGLVQQAQLPASPPVVKNLDIAHRWSPSDEVGGDFLDYVVLNDGTIHFLIGDVTGHGLNASLRMCEVYAYFRAFLRFSPDSETDPIEVMTRTNRLLSESLSEIPLLATAMILTWDPATDSVSWVGAGHQCYLLRESGAVEILESTGPILGCTEHSQYTRLTTNPLQNGDVLLLATDGLAESCRERVRLFGRERMLASLRRHAELSADDALERLFNEARNFHGKKEQEDDMTAILVRRR